jgi:hypothetical protein
MPAARRWLVRYLTEGTPSLAKRADVPERALEWRGGERREGPTNHGQRTRLRLLRPRVTRRGRGRTLVVGRCARLGRPCGTRTDGDRLRRVVACVGSFSPDAFELCFRGSSCLSPASGAGMAGWRAERVARVTLTATRSPASATTANPVSLIQSPTVSRGQEGAFAISNTQSAAMRIGPPIPPRLVRSTPTMSRAAKTAAPGREADEERIHDSQDRRLACAGELLVVTRANPGNPKQNCTDQASPEH